MDPDAACLAHGRFHIYIKVLLLNAKELTEYRKQIIQTVRLIEKSMDSKALSLLHRWLGFPDDLPNLAALRPPGGNTSPPAVRDCSYQQRLNGGLPDYY